MLWLHVNLTLTLTSVIKRKSFGSFGTLKSACAIWPSAALIFFISLLLALRTFLSGTELASELKP